MMVLSPCTCYIRWPGKGKWLPNYQFCHWCRRVNNAIGSNFPRTASRSSSAHCIWVIRSVLLANLCSCLMHEMICIKNFRTMLKVLLIPYRFFHCPLIITIFWTNTTCNKFDYLKNGKNRGRTVPTGNKLQSINPTIDVYQHIRSLSHSDAVIIHRLHIGYTRLTHSYLLSGTDQPECSACHCPLTVKHILIECPALTSSRRNILPLLFLKCH